MPKRRRHRQPVQPPAAGECTTGVVSSAALTDLGPQDLATLLLEPARVRPIVVISRLADDDQPRLDGDSIAVELKGVADVVAVTNGSFTYELETLLPADTNVFGNAARVYPPGLGWTEDPYSSPLRLVRSRADIETVTARIVSDAESVAFAGGWNTASPAENATSAEYGIVTSVAPDGSRAVVELDTGLQVFLPVESTGLDVPLHWMLRAGASVPGMYDGEKRVFSISGIELPAPGNGYPEGCVVPALVHAVETRSAELSLIPGVAHTVELSDISSNELDSAADLLTVGEVVPVRLYHRVGQVRLSLLDVDDSEPIRDAPELIPGGGPWLLLGRDLAQRTPIPALPVPPVREAPDQSTAAGTKALESVQLALSTERARRQQLETELQVLRAANEQYLAHAAQLDAEYMLSRQQAAELSGLQQEVDRLRRDVATANGQLSDLRKKLRSVRKEEAMPANVFLDPAEDFDFRLTQAWALQIPASEKGRLGLGHYRMGEDFLRTLRDQPHEKQKKAFKAIVDLLINDPARLNAREAHQLRTSAAGGSEPVSRHGGQDSCWRLAIEQNVPAARRLHYWKCSDGVIELSRVAVHDETQP